MDKLLIIDDDKLLCKMLSETLFQEGYESDSAHSLEEGFKLAQEDSHSAIFLDLRLPDGNSLDNLTLFTNLPQEPEVIIMTGYGDEDAPGLALKYGAWDYIEKPFASNKILLTLTRALEYRQAKISNKKPKILKRKGIIGNSQAINNCLDQLAEAASGDYSLLITGETGTGKELFARSLHANSARAEQNFIVVDCAALSETLAESSLFGHIKGAFTGAHKDHRGLIQLAHKGSLFLDEIGELPLEIQKKFLRVLEGHTFRPTGSTEEIYSDFRLISATNKDLQQLVEEGKFRLDLLHRIRSRNIHLPALRERIEDLPEIVTYYLAKICKRMQIPSKQVDPEFIEYLSYYHWPGNVRELVNLLDQVISTAQHEPKLYQKHLPLHIRATAISKANKKNGGEDNEHSDSQLTLDPENIPQWKDYRRDILEKAEFDYFQQLSSKTGGDIKKTAEIAGLTLSRVYNLIRKHNIPS